MTEDDKMASIDDYDDMTEDEFDAEFRAGQPAELVTDHRVRMLEMVGAGRTNLGQTWANVSGSTLIGPNQRTVTTSVVLTGVS